MGGGGCGGGLELDALEAPSPSRESRKSRASEDGPTSPDAVDALQGSKDVSQWAMVKRIQMATRVNIVTRRLSQQS